jgi:peptide/bleomycin uptake transporter
MFKEFFFSRNSATKWWAWFGIFAILSHSVLRSYVKYLINNWMGRFYDIGGNASQVSDDDTDGLQQGSEQITELLFEFVLLCLPSILIHPFFKFIANRWILSWRVELINTYILKWNHTQNVIENGAQRIHEDTQRFSRGIQICMITIIDCILTLVVFSPVLLQMGAKIKPFELFDSWLMLSCIVLALFGAVVSLTLGWSLIRLEIENQKVEADLRTKLVLYENNLDLHKDELVCSTESNTAQSFRSVLLLLKQNYKEMYKRFAIFSLWLGAYEQISTLFPYVIAGPLLFSNSNRVTLGDVTKIGHAFSNVFSSLNIISDRWVDVTDLLSVIKRLNGFEVLIYSTTTSTSLIQLSTQQTTQKFDKY